MTAGNAGQVRAVGEPVPDSDRKIMTDTAPSTANMVPTWTLITLGFAAGTLFGALALGDLGQPVAERPPTSVAATGVPEAPSDPAPPRLADPPGEPSLPKETEPDPGARATPADDPRIAAVLASWRAAEARIADLQTRLVAVEQALAQQRLQADDADRPSAPTTGEERRDLLVSAGVAADLAEDIVWRESRVELDRLNLRDQAVREGWLGSDRYREALNALSEEGVSLREEIGDAAWDRYLYLTGEDNRVSVTSVIPGSAAEAAGLEPGDLIESYAGTQPFRHRDLRQATTEGEKDELVPVRVRRGERVFETWVPRGPLGVRLGMTRIEPLP
jgi:hypothetical protein